MMPVMDGYAVVEELRKDPLLASIPVVIITAGGRVDRPRLKGVAAIMWKPIDLPGLIRLLTDLGADRGTHS
jgi:two-component system response regulator